jgi:hypothetical protein
MSCCLHGAHITFRAEVNKHRETMVRPFHLKLNNNKEGRGQQLQRTMVRQLHLCRLRWHCGRVRSPLQGGLFTAICISVETLDGFGMGARCCRRRASTADGNDDRIFAGVRQVRRQREKRRSASCVHGWASWEESRRNVRCRTNSIRRLKIIEVTWIAWLSSVVHPFHI